MLRLKKCLKSRVKHEVGMILFRKDNEMGQDGKGWSTMEQKGTVWYVHGMFMELQTCDSIKLQEWNAGMGEL